MGMSGKSVCVQLAMSISATAMIATQVQAEETESELGRGGVAVYIRGIAVAITQMF